MLSASDIDRFTAKRGYGVGGSKRPVSIPLRPINWLSEMTAIGHEDQLLPLRLSAGCGLRKKPFAGSHGNERDAPISVVH